MGAGRARGRWWSRRLLAGVVAATIAGPLALAEPAPADPLNISDIGVDAEVAQATLAAPGQVDITWQDEASVIPGTGTLVRARLYNDGLIPQLDATLTIDAGGQLDPDFAVDPACEVTEGAVSDTVTCEYGQLDAGASTPLVYVAVETGATPVVSTASGSATPDSLVPVEVIADDDETDSVTTTVSAPAGFAFLTDGEATSFTSASGNVRMTFAVPVGATNGGGYFVHLYEGDSSLVTCGVNSCYQPQARADFVQVGGTTEPAPATPLRIGVTYPNIKQTCNGLGGPSGCNPIHYLPTGVVAGPAPKVPLCSTYAPNGTNAFASSDPCLYGLTRTTDGIVTYALAVLEDIGFPIPKIG